MIDSFECTNFEGVSLLCGTSLRNQPFFRFASSNAKADWNSDNAGACSSRTGQRGQRWPKRNASKKSRGLRWSGRDDAEVFVTAASRPRYVDRASSHPRMGRGLTRDCQTEMARVPSAQLNTGGVRGPSLYTREQDGVGPRLGRMNLTSSAEVVERAGETAIGLKIIQV